MSPVKTNATLSDRLKVTRDEQARLKAERTEKMKVRDDAKEAFAGKDLPVAEMFKDPDFAAAQEAVKAVGEIDDQLADLKQGEVSILEMLGQRSDAVQHHIAGEAPSSGAWSGHRLLDQSEGYKAAVERGVFNSRAAFGTLELGEIASREYAMSFLQGTSRPSAAGLPGAPSGPIVTPTDGSVPPDYRGIIPPRLRQLTLLDLIPTGTTDSNQVNYVQVTAIPAGAAETPELGLKPQLGLSTRDEQAPVQTIAGYIKMSRQSMSDYAGLATLVNTLLPYDVRRRIESAILAGDGEGVDILGLLNTTGIGEVEALPTDNPADGILKAMTVIILSDSDPDFVAVNPLTWQQMLLMRTGAQDGAWQGSYLYGGPGMISAPTVWGMTMTPSRIIASNAPLVGDSSGATIMVREGVNVKTSDSDQDDFVRNRVTVLAEARIAFPVWRPSSFCVANLDQTAIATPN
jgi:HK97 family phage major capsid protein